MASPVPKRSRGKEYMNVVFTLVERGGAARSFHVASTRRYDLDHVIVANVKPESHLMTDELPSYRNIGKRFASHDAVNHMKEEYARRDGDKLITTNTVEGYYSIFKRGMKGVYQHCSEKHLHRYLAEFDFRYSNRVALGIADEARTERVVKGIVGKRLTYRPIDGNA